MDQRNQAIGMLSADGSQRHVARVMNCNQSTISALLNRYQQHAAAVLSRQQHTKTDTHARDWFLPAAVISRHTVGTHNRPINGHTVRRRLADVGLKSRRPYTGQILLRRHKQARLAWANAHTRWPRQKWKTVLFTDESKFNRSYSDGRRRVFHELVNILLNVVSWR